jgi:hypothetical protein
VPWVEVFAAFIVSHVVGDFLLQTHWQAANKPGGLGRDPVKRRALIAHVFTYTLAYIPALVWLAEDLGAWTLLVAAAIAVPHLIQDDGRLVAAYTRSVKGIDPGPGPLLIAVDQSFHLVALFLLAVIAGS